MKANDRYQPILQLLDTVAQRVDATIGWPHVIASHASLWGMVSYYYADQLQNIKLSYFLKWLDKQTGDQVTRVKAALERT